MTGLDAFREWRACGRLRQADMDRLRGAGVATMALAEGPRGVGYALARDLVVPDAGTMEVDSQAERRRLLGMMAVRLPEVMVRSAERRAAA